jgi:mono/diheme cytochrome c family protein
MPQMNWTGIGKGLAALIIVVVLAAALCCAMMMHSGFSARAEPTRMEAMIARSARHFATPAAERDARNPVPLTPAVLAEARAHWADHCAGCHGNDGKGTGGLGARMYPRTPDMTLASTQSLSDGEIFSIIENGVRLTGMPAFGDGTAESARETWPLVDFIRLLPKITPEDIGEMEKLNPKSPEEWQQMQQEAAFLAGSDVSSTSAPTSTTHSHHH